MRQIIRSRSKSKHCPLCAQHSAVDYKDALLLKKYVSERGKILSRSKTGACSKHQRQLTKSIKRARVMALLPFAEK